MTIFYQAVFYLPLKHTEFHSQRNSLFKLKSQFSVSVDSFVILHRRSQAIYGDPLRKSDMRLAPFAVNRCMTDAGVIYKS